MLKEYKNLAKIIVDFLNFDLKCIADHYEKLLYVWNLKFKRRLTTFHKPKESCTSRLWHYENKGRYLNITT